MDGSKCVMQLNEYAQRNRLKLFYDDVPQSNGTFAMNAVLDNERYPEGLGHTKKEAKQNAAKNALQKLSGEIIQPNDSVASQTERPSVVSNGSIKQANYTCWLNEYGQKQKVKITPIEFSRLTPTGATQCCKFVVGDREFPEAYGKTRKEAKEEAARLVYEELNRTGTTDQERDEASVRQVTNEMDELSLSITEPTTEMNYIGILNEYCQKNNMVHNFKLLDKKGPPNSPQFFYTAIIDKKEYPEGKGNSAKEAKQNAAQQALDSLKNETPSRLRKNPLRLDTGDCSSLGSPALRVPQDSAKEESSGGIVFADSSGVQSPKTEIIAASTKPKRKLAVQFPHESPDKKQETSSGASAQKSPTQASRFSQDYDTITRIGKGGFGRVYKARRKLEKKFFAVKIVDSGTKSLREVSALVNLHHRNIVQYYSSWEEDTSSGSNAEKYLYIQMELCKSDLKTWIAEKNGNQSPSRRTEALDIAQQVVNGVEYIHKEGFIHRDLKPANILFDLDGKVKIGDFGLVTFAENAIDGDQLKRTGKRGTKSYMSPEQMESYNYDKKVDIFAVGLIYFELLWPMKTNMEKQTLWQGIRNEKKFPPEFPSKYSAEVNDVSYSLDPEHKLIEKMLDQKPSVRPEASEITSELEVLGTILQGKNDRENRTF